MGWVEATVHGFDLRLETAPGLFSPNRLDAGTLAMLDHVTFQPDDKVLDLGCGYGVVGVVAAKAIGAERVHLADNDRVAVEIAKRNLALNDVGEATVWLSDGLDSVEETGFTKILSNPPYHVDFAVPKRFIEKGFNRLAVGGSLWMVTRREAWYRQKLSAIFGGVRTHAEGGYVVFEAQKRSATYANRR